MRKLKKTAYVKRRCVNKSPVLFSSLWVTVKWLKISQPSVANFIAFDACIIIFQMYMFFLFYRTLKGYNVHFEKLSVCQKIYFFFSILKPSGSFSPTSLFHLNFRAHSLPSLQTLITPTLSGPKTMVFVLSEGGNLSGNISASFRTVTRHRTRQSVTHLRQNNQQVLRFHNNILRCRSRCKSHQIITETPSFA